MLYCRMAKMSSWIVPFQGCHVDGHDQEQELASKGELVLIWKPSDMCF